MKKNRTFEKQPLQGNVYSNQSRNMDEETQKKIEELRNQHVISEEELSIVKEQKLLSLLYEGHELMKDLLDKGVEDPHYIMMETLIKRLETYLQTKQDLM